MRGSKHGTPTFNILCSASGVIFLSWLTFQETTKFQNFVYSIATLLEFTAFVKLRIKNPNLHRPCRIPSKTFGVILLCYANTAAWGPKLQGETPLHLAVEGRHLKVMDVLLQHGVNIDAQTRVLVGDVAVVGKPNVGQITLSNQMVGQKLSIVPDLDFHLHMFRFFVTRIPAQSRGFNSSNV